MHAAELIWNSWENGQKIVSLPKKLIFPPSQVSSKPQTCRSVDFPAPDGAVNPTKSPANMVRSIESKTISFSDPLVR